MAQTATEVSTHHARVVWKGTKQDLRAHEIQLAERTIECSNAAHLGGDPAKPDPEEMFVAALSSCHMLWFLFAARERRLRVTSYEDEAEGTMDGTRFTRVALRPRIEFESDVDRGTLEELHHEAHERCFIANSVNCPVEVEA
jgi:organic hydroperoxide reductase OsmC/OhrA